MYVGEGIARHRTYSNAKGQESGECTGDTGGAEEHGLSELSAVARVPESNVIGNTGVQTGLCKRLLV
jgi:hypothetical protein